MRNQQAAEREEQQRIKNLVLNYDLREDDQNDGISHDPLPGPIVQRSLHKDPYAKYRKTGHDNFNSSITRPERIGRGAPRARRLNLADVDWYAHRNRNSIPFDENKSTSSVPLAAFLKEDKEKPSKKPG